MAFMGAFDTIKLSFGCLIKAERWMFRLGIEWSDASCCLPPASRRYAGKGFGSDGILGLVSPASRYTPVLS